MMHAVRKEFHNIVKICRVSSLTALEIGAILILLLPLCRNGSRGRLKIDCLRAYGFKSHRGYQNGRDNYLLIRGVFHMSEKEKLEEAVKNSFSFAQVLKKIGLAPKGGNYRILQRKIKEFGLDISHFTGKAHLKGKTHNWSKQFPLENILVENSNYQSYKLKNRLIKQDLIVNKCSECGLQDTWNGKKINLHLDHINGNNTDNRLENLRMLCPNCHSQTDTYTGKNK